MSHRTRIILPLAALLLLGGEPVGADPGPDSRPEQSAGKSTKKTKKKPATSGPSQPSNTPTQQGGIQGGPSQDRGSPPQQGAPAQQSGPAQQGATPTKQGQPVTRPQESRPTARPPATGAPQTVQSASPQVRAPEHSAARIEPTKAAPVSSARVYTPDNHYRYTPLHHTLDHRFARPHPAWIHPHPHAHFYPPSRWWYRPYYTRWWVHPWWRWRYATVAVVSFHFAVSPWVVTWAPPPRVGFVWVPGYYTYEVWQPGYWAPENVETAAPSGYTWVPGWWEGDVYVEGFWRLDYRTDGDWVWVEGHYLDDGSYARGDWRPAAAPPPGYIWESGFWDGEGWIDGFWRPQARPGYAWVEAYYDASGIFNTGYWYPNTESPGQVWIPGWFDGNEWVEGYWVDEQEYRDADPSTYVPESGWDAGWGDSTEAAAPEASEPEIPLALPVDYPQ